MKKCTCGDYSLTLGEMCLLAPSKVKKWEEMNCPICKKTIRATKKSKILFVTILVLGFFTLGVFSAAFIPNEKSFLSLAITGIGLLIHYLFIWPVIIELELSKES